MKEQHLTGFTLAELLICLAILGEIATFTIPKLLSSQQDQRFNAIAKEVAGTLASAYQVYFVTNAVTASTNCSSLTPYLNYAKVDTTSRIDSEQGGTYVDCSDSSIECFRLHNGAILWDAKTNVDFGGVSDLNAIYFLVDPDGVYSNSTNGYGKSIKFYLYRNGRVATWASISSGTITHEWGNYYVTNADATRDPSWFSW